VSQQLAQADAGVHGPVDFVIIEFPGDQLKGEVTPALIDLVESGTIHLWDVMVISKNDDGTFEAIEIKDDPSSEAGEFSYFAGAASGLLDDDDLQQAADAMEPGTVAALLVYENAWAVPFVAAARRSGGELIASGRIPAPVVMEALEALDSA